MTEIGVGLIGSGYMGKCHAIAWSGVRAVFGDTRLIRLAALADVNETLARAKANEFGFETATGDWRTLLERDDISVISITAPNTFHAPMAIAALEAGKHIWCEKPMAPSLKEAAAMRDASRASGKIAILGYNYIQNPLIREIGKILEEGAIGTVNHVRLEMDEDFLANANDPFTWRSDSASGYGAIDDFAVHPLSLLSILFGPVEQVMTDMSIPYATRPDGVGGTRNVETHDVASVLLRLASGAAGTLLVSRTAWGRKGRVALQIFGDRGSILFDQERMNEFQIYRRDDPVGQQGYRTILTAPDHPPYDRFIVAPGHGLGFNDLKIIECRELLEQIDGKPGRCIDFEDGYRIEQTVHAMARSFREERWASVADE